MRSKIQLDHPVQRTASESATTMIMRGRRMELGGLQGLQGLQGLHGGGGKLVHDPLFSPSGSVASAASTTVSDGDSVRRAFSMVQWTPTYLDSNMKWAAISTSVSTHKSKGVPLQYITSVITCLLLSQCDVRFATYDHITITYQLLHNNPST